MRSFDEHHLLSDSNDVMTVSCLSVLGDREEQQDSFCYYLKPQSGMVAICDGMGGHEGGRQASGLAAESFEFGFENLGPNEAPDQFMMDTALACDEMISSLTNKDGERLKAGSTCVALTIQNKELFWCSVGDSRAYLLRGNEFVQLTQDQNYHSVLQAKLETGLITEEEYRSQTTQGEALISYLGIGNLSLIDYNSAPLPLVSGDVIVMMSDGLYRLLSDDEIKRVVENFSNHEDALYALDAKAGSAAKRHDVSRDNMTVAIISIK